MNTDYGLSNNFLGKSDFGGYTAGQFNYITADYAKTGNTDITIITNDGDRVTISSDMSMESSYTSYSGLLRSGAASSGSEGYEYRSQMHRAFSMSITGDLDSREYDAIVSALETIDTMMGASSGSMEDLQAAAEKFGALDSLSSLSASVQVKESIAYEQVQAAISGVNDPGTDKESKNINRSERLDHALSRILNSGKKQGKGNSKARRFMNEYLSGLLDSLYRKTGKSPNNRGAGELMKNMIMNRFDEISQEEKSIVDKTKLNLFNIKTETNYSARL